MASQPTNAPGADHDRARLEWERAYAAWYASGRRPQPSRRWYGWQTLLVDFASLGLFFGAAADADDSTENTVVGSTGLVGYVFGAPVVHVFHGHWGKAGASFGFRAASPLLFIASVLTCDANSLRDCGSGSQLLAVVGGLGFFAVPIVDAVVNAKEEIEPEEGTGLKLVPWIASAGSGGGVSIARRW